MLVRSTVAGLVAFLTWSAQAEDPVQILRTGLWHGDEVAADVGDDWWGVFAEGDGYTLQPAPVTITRERDVIMDDPPDNPTGKRVRVPQEQEPEILIRGLENPVAGPLRSANAKPPFPYLPPGEKLFLGLNEGKPSESLRMEALGVAKEMEGLPDLVAVYDYQLKLFQRQGVSTLKQVLPKVEVVSEDSPPRLLWAGDLDRDGKIDLLFDLTWHYNVTHLALFLSSAAKPGEFVGLVAEWRTVGC